MRLLFVAALLAGAGVGTALAQCKGLDDFGFVFKQTGGNGAGSLSSTSMKVVGSNSNSLTMVDTYYTGTAPIGGQLSFDWTYSSIDTGTWDYAYVRVNGSESVIASNATQGSGSKVIFVSAGDTVDIGVITVDDQLGEGALEVSNFCLIEKKPCSGGPGLPDFSFAFTTGGTGTGTLTATEMTVTGSDGQTGFPVDSYYGGKVPATGTLNFNWKYDSTDTGCFDYGYVRINGSETVLACNSAAPASGFSVISVNAGDLIDLGVYSADDVLGAGTLAVTDFCLDTGGPTCKWDLNGDGKVCQEDLGILLAGWQNPYTQSDLGALLSEYNSCGSPCP